jgi:surface polysaccharide O-acyltransferase-like enzyme
MTNMSTEETAKGNRIVWTDFIRTISICLVVVIHTAGPLLYRWGDIPTSDWMTGNIFDGLARVSVPLLFMVSGYLLLRHQESMSAFYNKRFHKVVIPLLVWSAIGLIVEDTFKNYTFINAIKTFIYVIIQFPGSFHLWFLYELLAIYLFVPLIRLFVAQAEDSHLWYIAILWFIFGPVQDLIEHNSGLTFAVNLGFFTSYIGYFMLGYTLGKREFDAKWLIASGIAYLVSAFHTVYATYHLTALTSELAQYYYNYLHIDVAVMSISSFILLKKLGQVIEGKGIARFFQQFSLASFGIYLVHATILLYLRRAGINVFSTTPIISIPAVSALIILLSWGIVFIMQKIPIVKLTVPR